MPDTTDPTLRIAAAPTHEHEGSVTLINCFVVEATRDDDFTALWTRTSGYFRTQPGFLRLHLHRAVSPATQYRYVNVASWASAELFQAAHATEEFRALVSQPAWKEFPSNPALYEVIANHAA